MEDLAREFPNSAEVQAFTSTLIPLLSAARHFDSQPLPGPNYYGQHVSFSSRLK
jgi:hypothetical protein